MAKFYLHIRKKTNRNTKSAIGLKLHLKKHQYSLRSKNKSKIEHILDNELICPDSDFWMRTSKI